MNKIDFLKYSQFPTSAETLSFMQDMVSMVAKVASMGGTNYILDGCVESGSNVGAGTVCVAGEIMPFAGGAKLSTVVVQETQTGVQVYDVAYSGLYITRTLIFGTGSGQLNWADFKRLPTLLSLDTDKAAATDFTNHKEDTVAHITANERTAWNNSNAPVSSIVAWPGDLGKIPSSWRHCDGSTLNIADYPELYSIIGNKYGGNTTTFALPNIKDKTIVGYDPDDADFNTIGKTGGEKKHTSTVEEMPNHSHPLETTSGGTLYFGGSNNSGAAETTRMDSNHDGGAIPWRAKAVGGGLPHNNLQPYIAMPYIIKVK